MIPGSHNSTTWCFMANDSMWCLPTNVHKGWLAGYYCRNDKESNVFQWQKNFILQHEMDTTILLIYQSSFSINQQTVLLYELITKKCKVLP